jgi:hypothetical protein
MSGKPTFRAGVVASFIAAACFGTVARAELPDFQCYRAEADVAVDRTFTLTDQFGSIVARTERLERLCNATNTNDQDPSATSRYEHLAEYTVRRVSGDIVPRYVVVTNVFGSVLLELRHLLPARAVIMPAALTSTPDAAASVPDTIGRFSVYHIHPTPRRFIEPVQTEDAFGEQSFMTRSAQELWVPAKMGDEDVVATDTPFLCYIARRHGEGVEPRSMFATDPLASGEVLLETERWQNICVPSTVVELH